MRPWRPGSVGPVLTGPDAPVGPLAAGVPDPDQVLGDPRRLAVVQRLVDSVDDATALDRLTRLAALLLDAPRAQVLLAGTEVLIASQHGEEAEAPSSPEVDARCLEAVTTGAAVVLSDLPGALGVPPAAVSHLGALLAVPLVDAQRTRLGALCVHGEQPRAWSPEQVGVLAEVAESVVVELELRALTGEANATAARLGLALQAADIGMFDLDVVTQRLIWDERLVRLFGYDAEGFDQTLDAFNARVHPEDLPRVSAAVSGAVQSVGDFSSEYRIVRPDGSVRWVEARGRVLPTRTGGRLLGVAYDSTALREARDGLARVLETMTDAFYRLDGAWRFTYVNATAERVLRRPREELLGEVVWEAFPETLRGAFPERYREAVASGEPVVFEEYFPPLDSWFDITAWPGPDGLSVYFRDITARKAVEAEREQAVAERARAYAEAEAANRRLALIADASTRLSESLEPRQVLERFGDLVLPGMAEWVVVALTAETAAELLRTELAVDARRVLVVHVAHADPGSRRGLAHVVETLELTTDDAYGVGAVVRTGEPQWLPEVPDEALQALATEAVPVEELRRLALSSALTVPLVNRGRVLGAVTLGEPAGGQVDRSLLLDVAGRAAVALDNALLYGKERSGGVTLQRSLLPRELPELPGLATAARYLPGAAGAFVGGDWYQGVRVGDRLVLAMGDVMGHGLRSAARMGQLRAIVATLALEGHAPGALLTRLGQHVDDLLDLELATLLVASYDPATGELLLASAGHPPPLLARPGALPRFLDVEPGPPLGSFAVDYDQSTAALAPGDTLLLYTDGLVEDRTATLDDGLARLRAALDGVALPPQQVCDHVLRALGRDRGGADDIAVLAVTLTADPEEAP